MSLAAAVTGVSSPVRLGCNKDNNSPAAAAFRGRGLLPSSLGRHGRRGGALMVKAINNPAGTGTVSSPKA